MPMFRKKSGVIEEAMLVSCDLGYTRFQAHWCAGTPMLINETPAIAVRTPDGLKAAKTDDWIIKRADGTFAISNDADFRVAYGDMVGVSW